MTNSATGHIAEVFRRHTATVLVQAGIVGRDDCYRGFVLIPRDGYAGYLTERDTLIMSRLLEDLLSPLPGETPFRTVAATDGSSVALDRAGIERDIASVHIFHESEPYERALIEYLRLHEAAPVAA